MLHRSPSSPRSRGWPVRTVSLVLAGLLGSAGWALAAPPEPEGDLADKVEDLYRADRRAATQPLLAAAPGAAAWSQHRGVRLEAVFHSRAEGLTVRAERLPGVRGELLVAIPPGTWAAPCEDPRDDDGPYPQDLLLIQAKVLRLPADAGSASVTLPVACASFRRKGPQPRRSYVLRQAAPGSPMDRLARVLCAEALPHERDPELALALWIAREGLPFERLRRSAGFHTFRTPRKKVTVADGAAAAKLLQRAGLDPARFDFFAAQGWKPQAPQAPSADVKERATPDRSPRAEATQPGVRP
jgi:hypothetical protein